MPRSERDGIDYTQLAWWLSGLAVVASLVYLMATASTGPADPTESARPMTHATAVFNSGMIVFREGLEAILIFAAVTASFLGANKTKRRPVTLGAAPRLSEPPSSPGPSSRPSSM